MRRNKKSGFSLLEVIAAVVILAVVAAATVATVAPMRAKSEDKLADQEVATLNAMAQTYFLEVGSISQEVPMHWQRRVTSQTPRPQNRRV